MQTRLNASQDAQGATEATWESHLGPWDSSQGVNEGLPVSRNQREEAGRVYLSWQKACDMPGISPHSLLPRRLPFQCPYFTDGQTEAQTHCT